MKVSVFCGTSVDGFLARPDGTFDFLDEAGSDPHGYDEFISSVDTIVFGRKTFEVVLGFGSWPYPARLRVVVLSSSPIDPKGHPVQRMQGAPAEVHAKLVATGATHVYLDGGITIQGFLRAGLVDRLVVSHVPVLIGEGIPLFGSLPHDVKLRLVASRTYRTGLVQCEYEVKRA